MADKKRKTLDKILNKIEKLLAKGNLKKVAETYRKAAMVAVDLGLESEVQEYTRLYKEYQQKLEAPPPDESKSVAPPGSLPAGEPAPAQKPVPVPHAKNVPQYPSMNVTVQAFEEEIQLLAKAREQADQTRKKIFEKTYATMAATRKFQEEFDRQAELARERAEDLGESPSAGTTQRPGVASPPDETDPNFYKLFITPETAVTQILRKIQKYPAIEEPKSGQKVVAVMKRAHGFFEIGVGKVWAFPNAINIMGPVMNTSDRVRRFNTGKIEVSPQLPKGEFLVLRKLPEEVIDRVQKNAEIMSDYRLYHFYMDL